MISSCVCQVLALNISWTNFPWYAITYSNACRLETKTANRLPMKSWQCCGGAFIYKAEDPESESLQGWSKAYWWYLTDRNDSPNPNFKLQGDTFIGPPIYINQHFICLSYSLSCLCLQVRSGLLINNINKSLKLNDFGTNFQCYDSTYSRLEPRHSTGCRWYRQKSRIAFAYLVEGPRFQFLLGRSPIRLVKGLLVIPYR